MLLNMRLSLMQKIDQIFGPVICSFLSVINQLFKIFKKKEKEEVIEKILAVKFWGMGSIILIMPSLYQLKQKFPQSKITFLSLIRNFEVLKAYSNIVDEVLYIDVDSGFRGFLFSILKLFLKLMRLKFDVVIDYEFFTRFSAIVVFFTRARIKAGFVAWEVWRGNLHNVVVPFNRYWHVSENFLNLTSNAIGMNLKKVNLVKPQLKIEKEVEIGGNYICINPNSGELALQRRWPKENFIKLTQKIIEEFKDLKIIFIGTSKEKDYVEEIVNFINHKNVQSYAGKLNFQQLVSLLMKSKLLISNDSGPLHLAVALNVPTISFFGPETPVLYGPLGDNHVVFFKNIDCSPCINVHRCKTIKCYKGFPNCLSEISIDEVYKEVRKFLLNVL